MASEKYYIYVLYCADNSFYCGFTNNVKRRFMYEYVSLSFLIAPFHPYFALSNQRATKLAHRIFINYITGIPLVKSCGLNLPEWPADNSGNIRDILFQNSYPVLPYESFLHVPFWNGSKNLPTG